MKTQGLNLFIVDDNEFMVTALRGYLDKRFGLDLNISIFYTGESALEKVDQDTNIVILDYYLEGENGNEVLKSIKKINPKTEVIMFSSNENIGIAIDAFRNGATDYVVKGEKSWKKITSLVYGIITYPVRILVREFGISKYIAMFLITFVLMGVAVCLALKFIP
ncbi:MAG: response regulator receiver protein [Bacteroidetes bacterium]|nr:MAG: response regulator receiver protein [Bacteroidota bacterium]